MAALSMMLSACNTVIWDGHFAEYPVEFASMEGSPVDSVIIRHGELIPGPVNPVRADYSFWCWYRDAGLSQQWNFQDDRVSGPMTLYASWRMNAGVREVFEADGVAFTLIHVPAGLSFPTGLADSGTDSIEYSFWTGETALTWEVWKAVYDWAVHMDRGGAQYTFMSPGRMGSDAGGVGMTPQHPVTRVSWYDAMVWCNALTEWYSYHTGADLATVYRDGPMPLRDATDTAACNGVAPDRDASGFRMLHADEWELAARYKGNDSTNGAIEVPLGSGVYWTPGSYASGATAYAWDNDMWLPNTADDDFATGPTRRVAWYDPEAALQTHPVALKEANALGLYDMSGNVWEWCFDWHPDFIDTSRALVGGGFYEDAEMMQTGLRGSSAPSSLFDDFGFRIARY